MLLAHGAEETTDTHLPQPASIEARNPGKEDGVHYQGTSKFFMRTSLSLFGMPNAGDSIGRPPFPCGPVMRTLLSLALLQGRTRTCQKSITTAAAVGSTSVASGFVTSSVGEAAEAVDPTASAHSVCVGDGRNVAASLSAPLFKNSHAQASPPPPPHAKTAATATAEETAAPVRVSHHSRAANERQGDGDGAAAAAIAAASSRPIPSPLMAHVNSSGSDGGDGGGGDGAAVAAEIALAFRDVQGGSASLSLSAATLQTLWSQPSWTRPLPPPVAVQVASRCRRGGHRAAIDGYVTRGAVGLFHPRLYLSGGDCIECGGEVMSRGRFEKLAGTATAKWHVSIKVLPSGMTLGRWLQEHGLPILQGRPRKRKAGDDDVDEPDEQQPEPDVGCEDVAVPAEAATEEEDNTPRQLMCRTLLPFEPSAPPTFSALSCSDCADPSRVAAGTTSAVTTAAAAGPAHPASQSALIGMQRMPYPTVRQGGAGAAGVVAEALVDSPLLELLESSGILGDICGNAEQPTCHFSAGAAPCVEPSSVQPLPLPLHSPAPPSPHPPSSPPQHQQQVAQPLPAGTSSPVAVAPRAVYGCAYGACEDPRKPCAVPSLGWSDSFCPFSTSAATAMAYAAGHGTAAGDGTGFSGGGSGGSSADRSGGGQRTRAHSVSSSMPEAAVRLEMMGFPATPAATFVSAAPSAAGLGAYESGRTASPPGAFAGPHLTRSGGGALTASAAAYTADALTASCGPYSGASAACGFHPQGDPAGRAAMAGVGVSRGPGLEPSPNAAAAGTSSTAVTAERSTRLPSSGSAPGLDALGERPMATSGGTTPERLSKPGPAMLHTSCPTAVPPSAAAALPSPSPVPQGSWSDALAPRLGGRWPCGMLQAVTRPHPVPLPQGRSVRTKPPCGNGPSPGWGRERATSTCSSTACPPPQSHPAAAAEPAAPLRSVEVSPFNACSETPPMLRPPGSWAPEPEPEWQQQLQPMSPGRLCGGPSNPDQHHSQGRPHVQPLLRQTEGLPRQHQPYQLYTPYSACPPLPAQPPQWYHSYQPCSARYSQPYQHVARYDVQQGTWHPGAQAWRQELEHQPHQPHQPQQQRLLTHPPVPPPPPLPLHPQQQAASAAGSNVRAGSPMRSFPRSPERAVACLPDWACWRQAAPGHVPAQPSASTPAPPPLSQLPPAPGPWGDDPREQQ